VVLVAVIAVIASGNAAFEDYAEYPR